MAKTITLIKGDTGKAIEAVLSNADGAQDLTGATVTVELRNVLGAALLTAACTVTDAETGTVEIPAAARANWPAGEYHVRWHVTFADETKDIFPTEDTNTITLEAAWS